MDGTRWLSAEQQRAWRRLAAVVELLPAGLEARLQSDAGLTHFGYWVLAMLSEAPGRTLRMSDLASRSHGSLSRLSHLVSRLEARGWVRRERSTEDGRGSRAVLTDAGYAKLVAAAPGHVEAVQSLVFDGLTTRQVAELDRICVALLSRLDPEGSATPTVD
jgi:DNA-binding MarR family transcriptional regulator